MNRRLLSLAVLLGLVASMGLGTTAARAASTPSPSTGQALEIAPPVISLTVNPGQTTQVQIYLRDVSSSNLLVSNEINDFVAGGQDGTPKLLLKDSSNNPYSMKTWIAPLANLNLVPKEVKSVNVTINVPANASPGGHYGVIRFTGTPAGLSGQGVSLAASLGALILVTVNGNLKENLAVDEFSVNKGGHAGSLFDSAPLNFVERLHNTGNVHVQPTGIVTIKNLFGKKIANVNVNTPPGNVLPNSTRRFEQPLDKTVLGNKRLFGRYTAHLNITYGTQKKVLASSVSFWVIPLRFILLLAVIIVVGFFGLRWFIRDYNRRVIARAQKMSDSRKNDKK